MVKDRVGLQPSAAIPKGQARGLRHSLQDRLGMLKMACASILRSCALTTKYTQNLLIGLI